MLWVSAIAVGFIFFTVGATLTLLMIYVPWLPLTTSTGLTLWGVYLLCSECLRQRDRMPVAGRVVLVTGCDTGLGHEMAKCLDSLGAIVFAGCLDSAGEGAETLRTTCSSNLHVVQLDVTNDEQIHGVYCIIKKNYKEIWGVVNNAGVGCWGTVEVVSMEWMQRTMDINTYGVVRVCKKFLPMLRSSRGRIVNISSVRGQVSQKANSGYCMSKFALEAFSDSLRREMTSFGVHVSVVEPGRFRTKGAAPEKLEVPLRAEWDALGEELKSVYPKEVYVEQFLGNFKKGKDRPDVTGTAPINEAVLDGLFSRRPCCRYLIGGTDNLMDIEKVYVFISWLVPSHVMDLILGGVSLR